MAHHIFQFESELQNVPEAAPKALRSLSISEKLAQYGSSALSGVEHLTLLVGKKSVALALIRHFGSVNGLARASFQELRQFLPRRQAESVVAALSMSVIAEVEHARSEQLDNPGINLSSLRGYEAFQPRGSAGHFAGHALPSHLDHGNYQRKHQRVLAHPREIFRPVIGQSAFAFVLVHNLCGGAHSAEYF